MPLELPSDPKLASKLIDSNAKNDELKIRGGAVGRFLGLHEQVPKSVAAIVALIAVTVMAVVVFFAQGSDRVTLARELVFPLLTSVLGFLSGRQTSQQE